ncbi:MAG: glycosyltransferase family 2 protein [Chloroflexi bacterium]|nr:glycosyltransferase family 2 protein [Chloroflexota bacterium]
MKVSVIVPTLNNVTLGDTLRAIENQTHPPDELIVVGRDEMGITQAFPQVRFVDTERPMCAAAARNIGMKMAKGDIFIFTDSDCIPNPDWVAQHLSLQQQGKQIVGGGVVIANPNYWAESDNISMFHEFLHTHPQGKRNDYSLHLI